MAGEAAVTVEDEAVVEVDLPEGEEAVTPPSGGGDGAAAVATGGAAPTGDEASQALLAAQKRLEEESRARQAAEARAQTERQRADNAARLAQTREQEAAAAREAHANSELQNVSAGLDNAKRAVEAAKADMKRAYEAGEADALVDAQARIADATADLKDFTKRKTDLEKRSSSELPTRPIEPPVSTGSPVEDYLASGNFAPAAKDWLRNHPDCIPGAVGGNQAKNDAMMAGHHIAKSRHITPNSAQYFALIEEYVNAVDGAMSPPPPPPPRPAAAPPKKAVPSAPPNNEPPAPTGTPTKRSVRLNAQQQEVALFSYPAKPGEDETTHKRRAFANYAQEFLKAQAEGKIGRTTH